MTHIRIDRDMLIEELYKVRALMPLDADEAKSAIMEVVKLVTNAPVDEKKAQFPKINARRG